MNFKKLNEKQILRLYSDVMEEFRKRKIVRSSNSPVADYAEKIVSEHLGLTLANGSNKGYDATDKKKLRYQVKSRRPTEHNKSRQLGVIRNLSEKNFDFLLAVIFDSNFIVKELWKIPHGSIAQYARYSKHQNGHILVLRGDVLKDKKIKQLL